MAWPYRVLRTGDHTWCHTRDPDWGDTPELISDLTLYDEHGTAIAEITGLLCDSPRVLRWPLLRTGCMPSMAAAPGGDGGYSLTGLWLGPGCHRSRAGDAPA